jgi:hypothetical protein
MWCEERNAARVAPALLFLSIHLFEFEKPSIPWSIRTARIPFRSRRHDHNANFVGGCHERSWKDCLRNSAAELHGISGIKANVCCGVDLGALTSDNDVLRVSLTVVDIVANVENFPPTPLNVASWDASLTPERPPPFRPDAFVAELPVVVR